MGMMSFTLRILFWSVNKYLYQDREESHEWWAWVNNNTATSTQMLLSLESGTHNLKTYFSCKLIPFWKLSTPPLPWTFNGPPSLCAHSYRCGKESRRPHSAISTLEPSVSTVLHGMTGKDSEVKTLEGWGMGSFPSCSSKVNCCCFQDSVLSLVCCPSFNPWVLQAK